MRIVGIALKMYALMHSHAHVKIQSVKIIVFFKLLTFNRIMGTLKPQIDGPLYWTINLIGTLAVDGWAVTFAALPSPLFNVPIVTAHPSTASVPTSY